MPEQNLPAAAVSRQPCADPKPGEFHNWVAKKDAEIERLRLALRIAVEEIQKAPHASGCQMSVSCIGADEEPCLWVDGKIRTVCIKHGLGTPACNCWKSSALARIERAKDGRTE